MRNLKRALSLALASVMLLGMMVVGTSAASYPDVDENDNVEAIEVLNAVKVMIGEQGNFNPDSPVNRHQMAVIMAKLVLGNETADNYVGTHPFTDVASWADKYVAACYENGIVAGTSKTTFGGDQPLTAVQAAAFMLRALGYKDLEKEKGTSDWSVPVTSMANQIRLFEGVASNPKQQLTRNQVAQLALNTLKSPVVTLKDNTISWSNDEGQLIMTGGSREYIVRFSREDYAYAINDTETSGDSASGIQGATIELGEHLYNGKLQLNNTTDDFGRPSRKWEFNGKTIGTYVKEELMVKEYVGKVTGKDLYDQLGSTIVNDYDLLVTVDGVDKYDSAADQTAAGVFDNTSINKNNKAAVGRTGTGTLTQVFVDNRNISARKDGQLYISVINTYLAKANQDYDAKKEELSVTIFGVKKPTSASNFIKDSKVNKIGDAGTGSTASNIKLAVEDFPSVTSAKKDDYMLVNVAGGDVITVKTPEILSGVTISGFKVNSDVVVDGNKYSFTTTAHYKDSDLAYYTGENNGVINLQDATYNVYLDTYGNLVGVEEVNPVKNYVFITGSDQQSSNYTNKTAKALALFLDGTTEEITYKRDKGTPPAIGLNNVWCTYTKDNSGVYTLRQVANAIDPDNDNDKDNELAQFNTNIGTTAAYASDFTIDSKNSTLNTQTGTTNDGIIYGRDDTVYLVAELDRLTQTTDGTRTIFGAVKGADTVIVDVKNTDLKVWSKGNAESKYPSGSKNDWSSGVYALYNDGYGIIAAVVIGEDNGASRKWYNTGDNALLHEDYVSKSSGTRASDGEWVWTRTLFDEKGNEVTLTERGDSASYLKNMNKNQNYLIKLDSKGEVYRAYKLPGDNADLPTVAEAGLVGYVAGDPNNTNKDAEYVTVANNIGAAVKTGKNQMLISCDVLNNKMTVSESGVLYVNNSNDSGILVNSDTKIVLIQINRNNRDTYTDGVGFSDVKSIINGLNEDHNNNNYSYKVSAVADKRVAKSIVIWDYTSDWNQPTMPSNDGAVYLADNLVKANVGSIKDSKVEVDQWGEVSATFTLTKPTWAAAHEFDGAPSGSENNKATAVLSYNIYRDGEAFMRTSDEIPVSMTSNYGYLTANTDGTEFTGTYRITKGLDLNGSVAGNCDAEMRNHTWSIEITDIDWQYAKVEYYKGTTKLSITGQDWLRTDWADKDGLNFTAPNITGGKATITGVKEVPAAATDLTANTAAKISNVQAKGGVVVKVNITGTEEYTVQIGTGSGDSAIEIPMSNCNLAGDANAEAGNNIKLSFTPGKKTGVTEGSDLDISVSKTAGSLPAVVTIDIPEIGTKTQIVKGDGSATTFTLKNVKRDIKITADDITVKPVMWPTPVAVTVSGKYIAVQFDRPIKVEARKAVQPGPQDGWGDLLENTAVYETGYLDGDRILVIKYKDFVVGDLQNAGAVYKLPKLSICSEVTVDGVTVKSYYDPDADVSSAGNTAAGTTGQTYAKGTVFHTTGGTWGVEGKAMPTIEGWTVPQN